MIVIYYQNRGIGFSGDPERASTTFISISSQAVGLVLFCFWFVETGFLSVALLAVLDLTL